MIKHLPQYFSKKKLLLLQGPVGPFFFNLAQDLKQAGAEVKKINFNQGDEFFYPKDFISFKGEMSEWRGFLEKLFLKEKFDGILLFGDCREIHKTAKAVAEEFETAVYVFEEGYLRPDFITFEQSGVNANSLIPKSPIFYKNRKFKKTPQIQKVGQSIYHGIWYSFLYYANAIIFKFKYARYEHHRPINITEGFKWIRSWYRKHFYALKEMGIQEELVEKYHKKFFLIPLQVYNDSQVRVHSHYGSNEAFLSEVVPSFAKHCAPDEVLVIKQHPFDRGYKDYSEFIRKLVKENHIEEKRVFYIHDQHLPSLLESAKGVVVINSTVGLQAIHHQCPTKVCGKAIYDILGMTFAGKLDLFWKEANDFEVDFDLYENFRKYLLEYTQINGNFMKPLDNANSICGVNFIDPQYLEDEIEIAVDATANAI